MALPHKAKPRGVKIKTIVPDCRRGSPGIFYVCAEAGVPEQKNLRNLFMWIFVHSYVIIFLYLI